MHAVAVLLAHVALAVSSDALPRATLDAALAEAAAIWRPYRVVVDARPCDASAGFTAVISVSIRRTARTADPIWRMPLGALAFRDGVPFPAIAVFVDEVVRIVAAAGVHGTSELTWPPALRDHIVGRVIGRVLAHEIGHFLLRDMRHTPTGLMRTTHSGADLVSPLRHRFGLTKEAAARVAATVGEERGPAEAGPERLELKK
jgi:hypothetical protein